MTAATPAFEPWERLMLLSRAIEETRREDAAELLPLVTAAAMCVVRYMRGTATSAEAYAHVERAREAAERSRIREIERRAPT